MGVPSITMRGDSHAHNVGVSLVTNTGHPEWVASTSEEYVQKAVVLASDIAALASLRARLRDEFLSGGVCAVEPFIEELETVYGQLWSRWIADAKRDGSPAGCSALPEAAEPPARHTGAHIGAATEDAASPASVGLAQPAGGEAGDDVCTTAAMEAQQKRGERQVALQNNRDREESARTGGVDTVAAEETSGLKTRASDGPSSSSQSVRKPAGASVNLVQAPRWVAANASFHYSACVCVCMCGSRYLKSECCGREDIDYTITSVHSHSPCRTS